MINKGFLLILACAALYALWFFNPLASFPVVEGQRLRLQARVVGQFQDRAKDIKNTPDLGQAINKFHEAKAEKRRYDAAIGVQQQPPPQQFAPPTPQPSSLAPSYASAIVVTDLLYDKAPETAYEVISWDEQNGEYQFLLDARVIRQVLQSEQGQPLLPRSGETWTFSFSDVLVCPWGVGHFDQKGTGGRASGLVGGSRKVYNADDFFYQNSRYYAASAQTGAGQELEIGSTDPYAWKVPADGDGRPVYVGFNIRQSEAAKAKGGGILTLKIEK